MDRMGPLKTWLRAAAMATVLGAVAACGGGGDDAAVSTLYRGNGAEPISLDPHKAQGTWENNVIGDMFIGLFTEDMAGEAIPGMADRWSVSDDGLTWTFTLRDAVWSDGVPVTAGDFVFGMRRILTPETLSQYATLLYLIVGAEAINKGQAEPDTLGVAALDDKTLQIKLEYPAPYLPGLLTHYTTFPLPAHVVREHGDAWIRPENVEVNGPYKLVEWRSNDYIAVEKNALFFDAANVCFDEVLFYPTNDSSAAERRVRSGELDLNMDFPGQKIEFLREEMPGYVKVAPGLLTTYLAFNTTVAPFDDVRVRQALSMAVDAQFIVTEILKSGEVPARAFVPPSTANYSHEAEIPWADVPFEARLEQARTLLIEAGFGPENPLRFVYRHRNTGDNPRAAPIMQDSWRRIGPWVEAELMSTETQIHYDNMRTGDFVVADAGWLADYNDAQNFLYLGKTDAGAMNYSRWSNAEYDALMDASNRELDAERRSQLMTEAENILLREAPFAPLWHGVTKALVSPSITGWRQNAVDLNRSRYLCRAEPDAADADG